MSDDTEFDGSEVPLMIITNDPTELKLRTLELIYESISYGQIAYMDGKDPESGEVVPLIVALEPVSEDKYTIYPIARLFSKDDKLIQYLVPNGQGEYYAAGDPAASLTDSLSGTGRSESSDDIVTTTAREETERPSEGLNKEAPST